MPPLRSGHRRRTGLLTGTALLALLGAGTAARAQDAGAAASASAGAGFGQSGAGGNAAGGGLTGSGIPSVPPIGGSVLPLTGADPASPDLRDNLLDAFGQTPPQAAGSADAGPGWQFHPSIRASETLTDNPYQFGGFGYGLQRRGDDAVTQITPGIIVTGLGERFQVNLDYDPTGVIYAVNSGESFVRQNFHGYAVATAVPELLYFDLRGSVAENPVFGGTGLVTNNLLPPSQRELTSNVSASPYLAHTFGGTGTLEAGVGYYYSATDAPSYLNNTGSTVPADLPYDYGSRWLATRRAFASFTTGEDYGRFQDELNTDDNFYDGSLERNAHRILVADTVSYAIDRFISPLGEIGYEDLNYPQNGYSYVGAVYSIGARITPNGESSLTLEYRRIDGISAPYAYGYWQITPSLRIFGAYSEGITTYLQDQQNTLLSGSPDATGVAASAVVAAPLVDNASLFGANQALTRAARANANLTFIRGRETVTVTFNHQRSTLIGDLLGLSPGALSRLGISNLQLEELGLLTTRTNVTNTGFVSWRHDLRPDLTTDVVVGYNQDQVAGTATGVYSSVQLSVALNKTFSETLTGRVAYIGNYAVQGTNGVGSGLNSNSVVFSVQKLF